MGGKKNAKSFDINSDLFKRNELLVESLAAGGLDATFIARRIGCSRRTLHKYFGEKLTAGQNEANFSVKGSLFRRAMGGHVSAQIFWLKAYAGAREMDDRITNVAAPIQLIDETDERVNPAYAEFINALDTDKGDE